MNDAKDIGKAFSKLGVAAKQKKAAERFIRVRDLRKKGLSAPKILEILNADGSDWKLRTIYEDFKKIKQVEARAPKKITHWFDVVESMRIYGRPLSRNIEHLKVYGFDIDPKSVLDYPTLKKEIEKAINADIHNIL